MTATIELEKNEKLFDTQTDDVFVKRFSSINKLLEAVICEDAHISATDLEIVKRNYAIVSKFASKSDNFRDYKSKFFGDIQTKQLGWIEESRQMLYADLTSEILGQTEEVMY